MISIDDLHAAAELVRGFTADARLIDQYGLTADTLAAFAGVSVTDPGPVSGDLAPREWAVGTLIMGISIGVVAAERQHQLST